MFCHVGYDGPSGLVNIDDVKNGENRTFRVSRIKFGNSFDVNIVLKKILSYLKNKQLGCLCICSSFCKNEIRKNFIECGLKYGFQKVEIIDSLTTEYIYLTSRNKYEQKNGDFIWIESDRIFLVWKKENGSAKLVDTLKFSKQFGFSEVLADLKCIPNAIFFKSTEKEFGRANLRKIFPFCVFYDFSLIYKAHAANIKARIMSSSTIEMKWNAQTVLLENLYVEEDGGAQIMAFQQLQSLPMMKSIELKNLNGIVTVRNRFDSKKYDLKDTSYNLCIVQINVNGIFTVQFGNINNAQHKPVIIQPIPPPLSKTNPSVKNTIAQMKLATSSSATNVSPTISVFNNHNSLKSEPNRGKKISSIFSIFKKTTQNTSSTLENSPSKSQKFKFPSKISINNDRIEAVGIDLGTSRCCAAVNRRNGIETVALENAGGRLLPSYVAYDERQDKCGQIVINNLRHNSKSAVFDAKRIIGKKMDEIEIDSIWPFSIAKLNNQIFIQILKCNVEANIRPEEVSASLLKYIKNKCEQFQGKPLSKAVITIPAVFTKSQKEVTIKAAKMAGWTTIELIPEPIAASFAYFIDRPIPNQSIILLFDLGGGTLDVCISKIENDEIQIISQNGDSQLGGRDFDKILINYFQNLLISSYGVSIFKNKFKLMLECQNLKENLSAVESASFYIDEFDSSKEGVVKMSQMEFEKMAIPLLNRIRSTINAALLKADLKPSQINKVLQVGGGSRMPMVKNLLNEIFPNSGHCCAVNPDEVVAVGAAYYAYTLFA